MNALYIEPGMNVWARDGLLIGRVGRVWHPDGTIVPPLPGVLHERDVVAGTWGMGRSPGALQINRFQAPDWFIPLADVASVVDGDVHVAFTEAQGQERGWRAKPVLLDVVRAGSQATVGGVSPVRDRPSAPEAGRDSALAAILLDQEMDLWRASITRVAPPTLSSKWRHS